MDNFIRAFFAIDLPPKIKNEVSDIISQLKNIHHSQIIRWIQPDNLHITLQFMAAIRHSDVQQLLEHAHLHLHDCYKSKLQLTKLELFPTSHHPRIISLNMYPTGPLILLAKSLGMAIADGGYPVETRPFRPHLTLGKIKAEHFKSQLAISPFEISSFEVNEIVLYQSAPNSEGSHYIPLGKISI